jgi:tight adherence protein C
VNFAGLSQTELLLLGLVFTSVVLLVAGIAFIAPAAIAGRRGPTAEPVSSVRYTAPPGRLAAFLTQIGARAAESEKTSERNHVRRQLVRAGLRNPIAVYVYYATRLSLAIALPVIASTFTYVLIGNISPQRFMLILFAAAAAGLFLPSYWLSRRVRHRQAALQYSFPDALDMLLVCVEAGASFSAALQRVAQELAQSHPELADELRLVTAGLSAGQSKEEALRQFAERAGTDDIASFATIIVQSEMFGTSISYTLRVQATEMRQQRMLRAEEMANKLPVKITFPLALLIFPVLLIVILTPLILRIATALGIKL